MIIQQDETSATFKINRYEPGQIWINQECYTQSIVLWPHRLLQWKPNKLSEVTLQDFSMLDDDSSKIVILGTGKELLIPSETLLEPFFEKGIGVEFMDSRAACHTFTVLSSEERPVVACILIT